MQRLAFIILSIIFINTITSDAALAEEDKNNTSYQPITPSIAVKNYTRLQELVPLYENAVAHPWPTISRHSSPNDLRERLQATGELKEEINNKYKDTNHSEEYYDEALENAVRYFQSCHGLTPDGVVGPDTRAELNISPEQRLNQVRVNLSRWAKLANELGNRYIMVNIPAYELDVVENGMTVLSMKAIVGKITRPTPEIDSRVTRVIFNPYWNVPRLIAQKDIVPKIIKDPDYLEEMNIKVINREEDSATEISPEAIDWQSALETGFKYHFRQDPGENNALGLVKFEFQNSHNIYMHDTPAKNLFMSEKRAFSSGCIRLEKPFDLASYLMKDHPAWDSDYVSHILEIGKTSYIKITPIPVIITYLTLWVDDNNDIQSRADIYERDVENEITGESEPTEETTER